MTPHPRHAALIVPSVFFVLVCILLVNLFLSAVVPPRQTDNAEAAQAQIEAQDTQPQKQNQEQQIEAVELEVVSLPEPSPPEAVEQAEPQPPAPVQVAQSTGGTAISSGSFSITGEFACSKSFYLKRMRELGAKVVVLDINLKRYLEVLPSGSLLPLQRLWPGFSPVARCLTNDHPRRSEIMVAAERDYGAGSYEILMLWPVSVETQVKRFLQSAAKSKGLQGEPSKSWVVYRQHAEQLVMEVTRISTDQSSASCSQQLLL